MRGVELYLLDNQKQSNSQGNGIREDIWRKYKRALKKDQTLEYVKMHQYFMTKKEKKLAKQKLNRVKGK